MPDQAVTLDDIRRASDALAGQVVRTPYLASRTLSAISGADVRLKFESQQFTGSFKDRGALNRLLALSEEQRKSGVIAMSAGNHAQGVAYHAGRLGIPATIVMPRGTPYVKVENTEVLGATIILEGQTVEEAYAFAEQHGQRHSLTFVHPYDDAQVIAGQGTIGLEILEDDPDVEMIVAPIGGGGLISGISVAVKAVRPTVEVIGVQAAAYPSMYAAIKGTAPTGAETTIADGIAVKAAGTLTRKLIAALVEDIFLVSEEQIERAILLFLEIEKAVTEGAGATPLAALLAHPEYFSGRRVALVVSGANIDPRLLSSVILSGLVRGGRMTRLRIILPDRPGMLAQVSALIGEAEANILDVHHDRAFTGLPVKSANLDVTLETRNAAHIELVRCRLVEAGFDARPLPVEAGISG
jgi:threonine dehydratase